MALEQLDGFFDHARVNLAPQRQWHDKKQPLELADFSALGCCKAEPLVRTARQARRLRNIGRNQ